jgi:hypothetical protein
MMTKKTKSRQNNRFDIYQFDHETFVVFDKIEDREICVCSNYDDWEDAEERAKKIVGLLNVSNEKTLG